MNTASEAALRGSAVGTAYTVVQASNINGAILPVDNGWAAG